MPEPLPIACSLTADAATDRLSSFGKLAEDDLIGAERRAHGIEFTFKRSEQVERALLQFIEAERQCCPFLDFELSRGEKLRLRIGGPDEAQPVLEAFLRAAA